MLSKTASRRVVHRQGPAPCLHNFVQRRRSVHVTRTPKDEVAKHVQQYISRVDAQIVRSAQHDTVPVTASRDGSVSGSIDGGLLELNNDTFWEYMKQQGDILVVVDFFTDWCGPCKLIYPELVKLSHERTDVRFVKVNCNKSNKELGIALGIKVAPTFQLYRNSTKVAEMTGAKLDKLVALINEQQPPASSS